MEKNKQTTGSNTQDRRGLIRGNTHFPFSDLNNLEIADQMSKFVEKNGLN